MSANLRKFYFTSLNNRRLPRHFFVIFGRVAQSERGLGKTTDPTHCLCEAQMNDLPKKRSMFEGALLPRRLQITESDENR